MNLDEIGGINAVVLLSHLVSKYRFLMKKKEIEELFFRFDADKSDCKTF
jgi:hypothetical protein